MRYRPGASFSAFAEPQDLGAVNRRTLGLYVSYREHFLVLADQTACKVDSFVEREPRAKLRFIVGEISYLPIHSGHFNRFMPAAQSLTMTHDGERWRGSTMSG